MNILLLYYVILCYIMFAFGPPKLLLTSKLVHREIEWRFTAMAFSRGEVSRGGITWW